MTSRHRDFGSAAPPTRRPLITDELCFIIQTSLSLSSHGMSQDNVKAYAAKHAAKIEEALGVAVNNALKKAVTS